MKRILLIASLLAIMTVASQAISPAEHIILSKYTETAPISISEIYPEASALSSHSVRSENGAQYGHPAEVELIVAKALKDIGSFLIKGLCELSRPSHDAKRQAVHERHIIRDARLITHIGYSSVTRKNTRIL